MYNDNFNQNKNSKDKEPMRSQQFFPGGFPMPPQYPGDNFPQGPGSPGMGQPPRSAPPNFIPEGPSMERGQMEGPAQFGAGSEFRGGGIQTRPGEIRRCINRFTFIWLFNGNSFWFYPTFVDRQFVMGFRWRRNRWEFERINLRRIFFFRCF